MASAPHVSAEDIAHEAILRVSSHSSGVSPQSWEAYYLQTVRTLFVGQIRRVKAEAAVARGTRTQTFSVSTSFFEMRRLVSQIQGEGRVVLLTSALGMTVQESSILLGIGQAAYKSRLFRAKSMLRDRWEIAG